MPLYGNSGIPVALSPGDSMLSIGTLPPGYPAVITAEASTVYPTSTAAERCALNPCQDGSILNISAEVSFSVAPGTYEIDVQTADTDINGAYQTVPTAGVLNSAPSQTGGAGLFYIRAELQVKAKFARLFVKTQTTNACNVIGKLSR